MRPDPSQKNGKDTAEAEGRNKDIAPVEGEILVIWANIAQEYGVRPEGTIWTQNRDHCHCTGIDAKFVASKQARQKDKICRLADDGECLTDEHPPRIVSKRTCANALPFSPDPTHKAGPMFLLVVDKFARLPH